MAELRSILTYARGLPRGTPRVIVFFSPMFGSEDGQQTLKRIGLFTEDGDVSAILSKVIEHAGIGRRLSDGTYTYLPWPCAAVEIRDLSLDELKRLRASRNDKPERAEIMPTGHQNANDTKHGKQRPTSRSVPER